MSTGFIFKEFRSNTFSICRFCFFLGQFSDYFIHCLEPYSTTTTCELSFHAVTVEWTFSVVSKLFIVTILTTSDILKRCTGPGLVSFRIYLIHKCNVVHRSDSNQDSDHIAIMFFFDFKFYTKNLKTKTCIWWRIDISTQQR